MVAWLRHESFQLRERAARLLAEIHRDLPDFTRHDVSHSASQWETSDAVDGESLTLNATEGFVLGAAFLLHDAALGLAALPGKLAELCGRTRTRMVRRAI